MSAQPYSSTATSLDHLVLSTQRSAGTLTKLESKNPNTKPGPDNVLLHYSSSRSETPPATYLVPIPRPGASQTDWEAFDKAEAEQQARRREWLDEFNKRHEERCARMDELIKRADALMVKARETWKELGRKQEEEAERRAGEDGAGLRDWEPYSEPEEWSDEDDSGCERSDWSGGNEDGSENEEDSSSEDEEESDEDEGMGSMDEDWWDDD